MPNRLIPILSLSCTAVFVAYIALVFATIFFASLETELSASMREAESRIASLETEYYDALATINATNVAAAGFHRPERVEYVAANGKPTVTLAETASGVR